MANVISKKLVYFCNIQHFRIIIRIMTNNIQFSSVQLLSRVWLFATSWIAARQASLSITNSQSLLKLMSIAVTNVNRVCEEWSKKYRERQVWVFNTETSYMLFMQKRRKTNIIGNTQAVFSLGCSCYPYRLSRQRAGYASCNYEDAPYVSPQAER